MAPVVCVSILCLELDGPDVVQVVRLKSQVPIQVCDLLTNATGLFTKPPTKVTTGGAAMPPDSRCERGLGKTLRHTVHGPRPGRPYHLRVRRL